MKNPNFTYAKFHKEGKAMKAHSEALKKRGCKLVEANDKKTINAFIIAYDNDKGGYWIFYRFGKDRKTPKYKKGDKFYYRESVGGKGIVVIDKVSADSLGRLEMTTYYLRDSKTNELYDMPFESDIEFQIENGDLTPIKK